MRSILALAHAPVADLEHVRVIPMTRPCKRLESHLLIEDVEHAKAVPLAPFPGVMNVTRGAPEICYVLCPEPRFRRAPFTHGEHDVPPRLPQSIGHERVGFLGIAGPCVAPVVLQIVDAPRGILPGVQELVSLTTGSTTTSLAPSVGVDPELQSLAVNVVAERSHSRGEACWIRLDPAICIAHSMPAVVDNHVSIACIPHTRGHHGVSRVADQLLVDIAAELIPAVPAHGRREREPVRLSGRRSGRILGVNFERASKKHQGEEAYQRVSELFLQAAHTFDIPVANFYHFVRFRQRAVTKAVRVRINILPPTSWSGPDAFNSSGLRYFRVSRDQRQVQRRRSGG